MEAHHADVHLRFLRLQLFLDLHSPVDGKLVHNKLLLQHLITTPIIQDIFLNSPSCHTFITRVSLGFVVCHYCAVKKCSFVVNVANLFVLTYSGWV